MEKIAKITLEELINGNLDKEELELFEKHFGNEWYITSYVDISEYVYDFDWEDFARICLNSDMYFIYEKLMYDFHLEYLSGCDNFYESVYNNLDRDVKENFDCCVNAYHDEFERYYNLTEDRNSSLSSAEIVSLDLSKKLNIEFLWRLRSSIINNKLMCEKGSLLFVNLFLIQNR